MTRVRTLAEIRAERPPLGALMPAPPTVECDVDVRQTSAHGLPYRCPPRVACTLRWDPQDPWAVQLDLDGATPWAVGWELLAAVVDGQFCAGVGDVRIWRGERVFRLVLSSPYGSAMFELDPHDLGAFVAAVAPRQAAAVAALPDLDDALHALIDAEEAR